MDPAQQQLVDKVRIRSIRYRRSGRADFSKRKRKAWKRTCITLAKGVVKPSKRIREQAGWWICTAALSGKKI